MKYIDIANIACGGHAGDKESVSFFRELAKENNVELSGHLSYPDKKNFGRFSLDLPVDKLNESLSEQYALIPEVEMIKFHGALYNDACINKSLSETLSEWLLSNKIKAVITLDNSELAKICEIKGIKVIKEAFAERRYDLNPDTNQLTLVNRKKDYASIHDLETAVAHSLKILKENQVNAVIDINGKPKTEKKVSIFADTICIHSDSDIALELTKKLSGII